MSGSEESDRLATGNEMMLASVSTIGGGLHGERVDMPQWHDLISSKSDRARSYDRY